MGRPGAPTETTEVYRPAHARPPTVRSPAGRCRADARRGRMPRRSAVCQAGSVVQPSAPRPVTAPAAVLDDLSTGLAASLGTHLIGLYAHGSLVSGDFAPARSDIDVLAVVVRPPDEAMLAAVAPVHV